jgi:hypothetical protein
VLNEHKIRELYCPLQLGEALLDKTVEAHHQVLRLGQTDGNEYVITIRCDNLITEHYTSKNSKKVAYKSILGKEYIVIHNHPSNSPFSKVDLHVFNTMPHHRCLSVQGHNGWAYTLHRDFENQTTLSFNEINEIFDRVRNAPANINLSHHVKLEIAVSIIARKQGWVFQKKEVA